MNSDKKQLLEKVEKQQVKIGELETQNKILQLKLKQLLHKLFGNKSEKIDPAQLQLLLEGLEDDAHLEEQGQEAPFEEPEDTQGDKKRTGKRGKKNPIPGHLEVVIEVIDVEEAEKFCATTGLPKKHIRDEISVELDYIPARFIKREFHRAVYACPHCHEEGEMAIAPLPARVIEGSNVGTGLLAEIAVCKYVYHIPLYRMQQIFSQRYGVEVTRQMMVHWIKKCAEILEHLFNAMKKLLLSGNYLQIDETPVKLMDPETKGKTKQAYLWVYSQPGGNILFDFQKGRSGECLREFINEQFSGVVQSDAYKVYKTYASSRPNIELAGCWAHCRRKFKEALVEEETEAAWVIADIQRLYRIEKHAREQQLDSVQREALRVEKTKPILTRIEIYLHKQLALNPLPQSALTKAIKYTLNNWKALCLYAQPGYGHVEIDNNGVENGIRPTAIGKKNWLFIGHPDAGWRSAVMYSIFGSCKRHNVEPYQYLVDVLPRIMDHPNKQIHELLPQNWKNFKQQAKTKVDTISKPLPIAQPV